MSKIEEADTLLKAIFDKDEQAAKQMRGIHHALANITGKDLKEVMAGEKPAMLQPPPAREMIAPNSSVQHDNGRFRISVRGERSHFLQYQGQRVGRVLADTLGISFSTDPLERDTADVFANPVTHQITIRDSAIITDKALSVMRLLAESQEETAKPRFSLMVDKAARHRE